MFGGVVGDAFWERADLRRVATNSFGNCLDCCADAIQDRGDGCRVVGLEFFGFAVKVDDHHVSESSVVSGCGGVGSVVGDDDHGSWLDIVNFIGGGNLDLFACVSGV